MSSIRRKLLLMLMILILPFQTPTPTPSPLALADDEFKHATDLLTTANNITALGIIALIVVAVILYIVLVARKRRDELEPLSNLIEQMQSDRELIKTMLGRQADLSERLFARDKEREDKTIESIAALTAAQESHRAIMARIDERDKAEGVVIEALKTDIATMKTFGSEPVQTILKNSAAILEACQRIETHLTSIPVNELRLAVSALTGVTEKLERKIGDSKPIPVIAVDPVEKQESIDTPKAGAA